MGGALRETEREFFADQAPNDPMRDDGDDIEMPPGAGEGSEDESSLALFAPLSDPTHFGNISNLRAPRLLFDLSARANPGPRRQQPTAEADGRSTS